ncbi:MAG: 3-hydroxyacyl-ACP dehydratase FabZ family protein [Planctomycetaceae bacterium]
MRYCQLDRLISLDPGKRLVAERTMAADEDYLQDHFPNFPVMPGVMMLEALHQAAIWMIRTGEDFQSPLVMLREARSVKFGDFLCPGETLQIQVELVKEEGTTCTVKATAEKNGRTTVSARLILEKCSTDQPSRLGTDAIVRDLARKKFAELYGSPQNLP